MPILENDLEQAVLQELRLAGYGTASGPEISEGGEAPERESYETVILEDRLLRALRRLNPERSETALREAVRSLRMGSGSLAEENRRFHSFLISGVPVREQDRESGAVSEQRCRLVDFSNPANNDFLAVNQFTVQNGSVVKRPDLVVFLNGLPVVVWELKNAGNEQADLTKAYHQLQTYQSSVPALFFSNAFLVVSDGINSAAGTLTSPQDRFTAWRSADGEHRDDRSVPSYRTLIAGMFAPDRLLRIIGSYLFYQDTPAGPRKILAAYHQFFAVEKALVQTRRAAKEDGDRRIGVVWHTQGSGKSLSMVFYARQLFADPALSNPTIVVITDRNDLDDQLFQTFSSSSEYLLGQPQHAESRAHLKSLLSGRASGGMIFTTIQKFEPDEGCEAAEPLTQRRNVIVIADEAHRSQYGFSAKVKTENGEASLRYGYARYLRSSLPNASFIGFTGTPVSQGDHDTVSVFGNYIDVYDMSRSIEDGTTVRLFYESRIASLHLPEELVDSIDEDCEEITGQQEVSQRESLKTRWSSLEALAGAKARLSAIAQDIVTHFEARQLSQEYKGGKAMIVVMSRRIAVELYDAITALRPQWHSDDLSRGAIKVVMTGSSSDPPEWQRHVGNKASRETLARRMKDPHDELRLVIVRDMWLTGFDVPSMHTMYVDKPMKGHNLMQAIARVNRVFQGKSSGLVVDYIGIGEPLKKAIRAYTYRGGADLAEKADISAVEDQLEEKCQLLRELLHGCPVEGFFSGDPSRRFTALAAAIDFVLSQGEERKDDFLRLTEELLQCWSLCAASPRSAGRNEEVGFYRAVKAGIVKLMTEEKGGRKTGTQLDFEMNQLLSRAVASAGILDVMGQCGSEAFDVSVLTEEALAQLEKSERRDLAVCTLQKLLKQSISGMFSKNLAQRRRFTELLAKAIEKYRRRSVAITETIRELIALARQMRETYSGQTADGLTVLQSAFRSILEEARPGEDAAALSVEVDQTLSQLYCVDWIYRSNVRARMKMSVKRLLRQHGYSPEEFNRVAETLVRQYEEVYEEDAT